MEEILVHLKQMVDKGKKTEAKAAKVLYNRLQTASLVARHIFGADATTDVVFHVHNLLAEHEALESLKAQSAPVEGGDAA
jgi:hypothetical protein